LIANWSYGVGVSLVIIIYKNYVKTYNELVGIISKIVINKIKNTGSNPVKINY
jgi:hypothetical protein